jgi:catechol 2,3-dioxygenase-like lactoylglutathione lyase family enzyme
VRLHHLAIRVRDLDAAVRFYVDVLGLRERSRPREGAVWLWLGEATLMIERTVGERPEEPFDSPRPGLHLFAIAIDAASRADWEARLASHGVPIVHRTGYSLYVHDPEGNRVALSHHPISAGP